MDADSASSPPRFTIVAPPTYALPTAYADAAFLHVLATRPDSVIPPGKSLRAALLRPDAPSLNTNNASDTSAPPPSLQEAVEKIVHRAFWDEARESLADPSPARQLWRLKALYLDLHAALEGLLPKQHPSYVVLSDPLSPTPAPLASARRHLVELVGALQERCAPVRDDQLSAVRTLLESEEASELPDRIVGAVKELLQTAEMMKNDLANTFLGAVSDEDLEAEIDQAAKKEERRTVLELFGVQGIRDRWKEWLAEDNSDTRDNDYAWIRRLLKALGADVAISCPPPNLDGSDPSKSTSTMSIGNALPPPFLFSAPELFRLQNHIQALVIAAVLRTLVPLRPPPKYSGQPLVEDSHENKTFAERVLALLMIEVDEANEDAGTTKLVHLADEVMREHRRLSATSGSDPEAGQLPLPLDEKTLRSRVDALLRPSDGVFVLLRKRLLDTLAEELILVLRSQSLPRESDKEKRSKIPDKMQTGRERERKRPRLDFHSGAPARTVERGTLRREIESGIREGRVGVRAKGYEDPVLRSGVGDVVKGVADIVEWVVRTWDDEEVEVGLGLGIVQEGGGQKEGAGEKGSESDEGE